MALPTINSSVIPNNNDSVLPARVSGHRRIAMFYFGDEQIAAAAYRLDDLWIARLVTEFTAQAADQGVDGTVEGA